MDAATDRRHTMSIRVVLSAVVTLVALLSTGRALAQVGVGLDSGKIDVTQRLAKGGSYQLPVVAVRNPGGERSTYQMGVTYLQGEPSRRPSAEWFTFAPRDFTLEPGAVQAVRITLDIPVGAAPADYAALIQAQVSPTGEGGRVGAAAATQLTFTVAASTALEAWFVHTRGWLDARAPWWYLLPGLALAALAVWWLARRFRLNLRIERRP